MIRLLGLTLLLAVIALWLSWVAVPARVPAGPGGETVPAARIHFPAVAAGAAVLIQVDDRALLIDGGDVESGEELLAYLRSQGVEELAAVVLTVGRDEHAGGLLLVLQEVPVEQLLVPPPIDESPVARAVERLAGHLGIPVRRALRGLTLDIGRASLEVLAPVEELITGSGRDAANNSVVLRLAVDGMRALFPGDLAAAGEERLRRLEPDLHAELLQVPAHGDRWSSGPLFLQAVQPQVAVISTGGYNGSYPDPAVLERLDRVGSQVYRTDLHGPVLVELRRGQIDVHLPKGREVREEEVLRARTLDQ